MKIHQLLEHLILFYRIVKGRFPDYC